MEGKKTNTIQYILIILMIFVIACGISFNLGGLQKVSEKTAIAQTVAAYQSETENNESDNETQVPIAPEAGSIEPTATENIPCDLATFVSDVTIPDDSEIKVGTDFTKTWRLKNIGSCTWNSDYQVVFFSGDQMGGVSSQQLTTGNISPGETVDISIDMTAPDTPGSYKGNWKFRNTNGDIFSFSNGNPFYVKIEATSISTIFIPEGILEKLSFFNYSATYEQGWMCYEVNRRSFKITNTGTINIESASLTLYGPLNNYLTKLIKDSPFVTNHNPSLTGCTGLQYMDTLTPGQSSYLISYPKPEDNPLPTTPGKAEIMMCSENGMGGECKEQVIYFTW